MKAPPPRKRGGPEELQLSEAQSKNQSVFGNARHESKPPPEAVQTLSTGEAEILAAISATFERTERALVGVRRILRARSQARGGRK